MPTPLHVPAARRRLASSEDTGCERGHRRLITSPRHCAFSYRPSVLRAPAHVSTCVKSNTRAIANSTARGDQGATRPSATEKEMAHWRITSPLIVVYHVRKLPSPLPFLRRGKRLGHSSFCGRSRDCRNFIMFAKLVMSAAMPTSIEPSIMPVISDSALRI